MKQSLKSILLLLIATTATQAKVFEAFKRQTTAPGLLGVAQDHVTVTSVVDGPSGPTTETERFVATTYSELIKISSTVTASTVITIGEGDDASFEIYTYTVGPGGVGWSIPTPRDDAPVLLAQPTFLPGKSSIPDSSTPAAIPSPGTSAVETPTTRQETSVDGTTKSINTTPGGSTVSDTTSAVVTPSEETSISTTTTAVSPGGSASSETTSIDATPSTVTPSETTTINGTPSGTTSDPTTSDATPSNPTSSEVTSVVSTPGESTPSESSSSDTTAIVGTPSETTSEDTTTSAATPSGSTSIISTTLSESSTTFDATTSAGITASETFSSDITTSDEVTSTNIASSDTTAGPVSTTSDILTSTITVPPADFTAITLSDTSFPANTWLTTTDSEDHTTIVPIIITGGGVGIIMWNFPPVPNVLINLPGLPKFHLPCVKVFGIEVGTCAKDPVTDGKPNEEEPTDKSSTTSASSTETTSEASCTTTTIVSRCEVQCAQTASNTCASFTTSCETYTGCSVTGSTTTILSTSSACTSCAGCLERTQAGDGAPAAAYQTPSPVYDDDDGLARRGVAGRIQIDPREIEKRGARSIVTALGACTLTTGAASRLTRPAWPAVSATMLVPDSNGKMQAKYSTISRWHQAITTGACGVPTTTAMGAAAFMAAPAYTDVSGAIIKNNNDASLDHAYEKSWVKDFFVQLVGSTTGGSKLSCADMNTFFFPKASPPGTCQFNLMQPAWNAIGSEKNLYFIAMSQFLNGDGKGSFFADGQNGLDKKYVGDAAFKIVNDPAWKWPKGKGAGPTSADDTIRKMLEKFERVLLGCLEMKGPSMLPLIDRTNNRIYDALLDVDNQIITNTGSMFPSASDWTSTFGANGVAGAYKDFMDSVILPQITGPPGYLRDLLDLIKNNLAEAENLPDVKADSLGNTPESHYQTGSGYAWDYTFVFGWDRNNKRDIGDEEEPDETGSGGLNCPFPSSTASEISSTAAETTSNTSSEGTTSEVTLTPVTTTSDSTSSEITTTLETSSSQITTTIETTSSEITTADPGVSTTLPPRVPAPDITVATATDKPECVQGYATYTLPAVASAPAGAESLKMFIPQADKGGDWEFDIMPGFLVHPKTNVESWTVGTSASEEPIASGMGGMDMVIKWTAPENANGTYVNMVFVNPAEPLGIQTHGVVAKGGVHTCMPDHCSGDPLITTDDNGNVCKKFPCSTTITCEPGGPITPRADCLVVKDGAFIPLFFQISIVTNNFISDGGEALRNEEKHCGAMTAWHREKINIKSEDGKWTATQRFSFTLPLTVKAGCVERAIASAGGPQGLRCVNADSEFVWF